KVQDCIANVCNIVPDSLSGTHGIGFLPRTGLVASGTFDCDDNGYSGTKTYTCTSNSTITTTPTKCYENTCDTFTNIGVTETLTGKKGVSFNSCTKPGYSGTLQFYCNDANKEVITTPCTENTCNVLSGIGYSGKSNQKVSGSFACDDGYYGTVNWVCNTGNANATVTHNCTRITCNPPESANASFSTLDYTGSTWTEYSCKTGYKAGFDLATNSYLRPNYKCEADIDGSNPSTISIKNACVEITCNVPGFGVLSYNGGNRHTINCNPFDGFMGTAILVCDEFETVTFIQTCNRITCNLPSCTSEPCPSNIQNTIEDGSKINFSQSFVDLNCKQSHYFDNCPSGITSNCGRPRVKCKYDPILTTSPNAGVVEFTGLPCQQSKCTANNDLNSVIDSTSVNWTGEAYVNTICKNGYYMLNPLLPPKYNCSGSGSSANYSYLNPCLAISCNAPANSFGINSDSSLSWGLNIQAQCNKIGYTGNFTYNCTGTSNPGIISITNNSCIARSCNLPSNNPTTFAKYVVNGQNLGGDGGKILSSSVYFKGGNGGKSSNSLTTGAGGAGGSASFIETSDSRIIVIAGGGGGGNGGGSAPINSPEPTLSPIADSKLVTNILGSYLIAKMQTLPIQNSDASKSAGLIYGLSDSNNNFNLNSPSGMFISDIFFSSLGNPIASPRNQVNPDSIPNPFSVKYGTCHSPNSFRLADIYCQGKDSCSQSNINELEFTTTCTPTISSKSWAMVAGYTYKEPSITVNGITKPVKEINIATMTFNPAILENNKVYSFLDFGTFWIKYAYWNDEFIVKTSAVVNASTPLKLKFHRKNNTLEPKLKITQISGSTSLDLTSFYKIKKIVNEFPSPISVGYIKENVFYILRLNSSTSEPFWEIREHTEVNAESVPLSSREYPKRTCMTTQLSENGMLGTVWSPANSICTNKCPGYDPATKVGDDRIGAGATLHYTSNLFNGGIVYWPDTTAGTTSILVMSINNSSESGLSNKGYNIFQPYNGSTTAKQFENEGSNQLSGNVFILERECGIDGIWRDPKPLCSTGGGSNTNPPAGNFNDTRVFLDHSSNPIGTIYNNNTTKTRYIRADSSDYSIGECLNGYDRMTDASHGIYQESTESQKKPKLTFSCSSYIVNNKRFEDLTYLNPISGTDCVKYCKMSDLPIDANSGIEKRGPLVGDNYKYNDDTKLLPSKGIGLDCKSTHTFAKSYIRPNYVYDEINKLNKSGMKWSTCEEGKDPIRNTDILTTDITYSHFSCLNKLAWEGSGSPGSVNYTNKIKNGTNYDNIRNYFDEGFILIAKNEKDLKMVPSNPVKPLFECIAINKDRSDWSSVSESTNCRLTEPCKITNYHGIRWNVNSNDAQKIANFSFSGNKITTNDGGDHNSTYFPLNSFIYLNETFNCGGFRCLTHGKTIKHNESNLINGPITCEHNYYGRCGYKVLFYG
ncbi:MAG: hypothetical protein ACKOXJ_00730, partial [Alphaproteobacteria bacterium]